MAARLSFCRRAVSLHGYAVALPGVAHRLISGTLCKYKKDLDRCVYFACSSPHCSCATTLSPSDGCGGVKGDK
jgi:hypothetical protein